MELEISHIISYLVIAIIVTTGLLAGDKVFNDGDNMNNNYGFTEAIIYVGLLWGVILPPTLVIGILFVLGYLCYGVMVCLLKFGKYTYKKLQKQNQ